MRLILASGSKNRITALKLAHIKFDAIAADIDEKAIKHKDIKQRQVLVAKGKVEKIIADGIKDVSHDIFSNDEPETEFFVLGADGVNIVNGKVLEKPENESQAYEMIEAQSGKKSSFLTGYYAKNLVTGKTYEGTSETFYTFRKLTESEIMNYTKREPVLTWAAAFSPANSRAITFVDHIEGSYSNFSYSMPFEKLMPIFHAEGL